MNAFSLPRLFAAALILVPALAACGTSGEASEGRGGGIGTATGFNVARYEPEERRRIPRFSGERLCDSGNRLEAHACDDGPKRITQEFLRGHVSVVNVWGSWCGPCYREQDELERIWRNYRDKGVRFLGIDVIDSRGNALAFLRDQQVTYPSMFDPTALLSFKFRVIFAPTTYVVDRNGAIAAKIVGALRSEADLTMLLDEELSR